MFQKNIIIYFVNRFLVINGPYQAFLFVSLFLFEHSHAYLLLARIFRFDCGMLTEPSHSNRFKRLLWSEPHRPEYPQYCLSLNPPHVYSFIFEILQSISSG